MRYVLPPPHPQPLSPRGARGELVHRVARTSLVEATRVRLVVGQPPAPPDWGKTPHLPSCVGHPLPSERAGENQTPHPPRAAGHPLPSERAGENQTSHPSRAAGHPLPSERAGRNQTSHPSRAAGHPLPRERAGRNRTSHPSRAAGHPLPRERAGRNQIPHLPSCSGYPFPSERAMCGALRLRRRGLFLIIRTRGTGRESCLSTSCKNCKKKSKRWSTSSTMNCPRS